MNDFLVANLIYGKLIMNKNQEQHDRVIATGVPHIDSELQNIFKVVDNLPEGSIIIDGGTNVGLFFIPVAQRVKHKNIKVIGFEPQRMLFSALSGSITLNGLNNCWLHNLAIGDTTDKVTLPEVNYTAFADYGLVSVTAGKDFEENKYMNNRIVDCITIDSMNLPRLDFIKLDIEGFEIQALKGAAESIKKYKPTMWVEYPLTGQQKIKECLDEILPGYVVQVMDPQNVLCVYHD